MRQYYKKQCLAALKTLEDAHKQLGAYVDKGEKERAAGVLELCQQSAVDIGELIEASEGEDAEEVRVLEEYCELAYQYHERLLTGDAPEGRKLAKKLDKPLIKVTNGVNNRIPTQREVVFLPYKASMWDSLESVWRRMDADPDTTALVVPIPYYDRNADGSFGAFHYEGELYPADVPVVRYDQYDMAARHPDAIYIHNGYDDSNLVTSVHPDYYSSKLKEQTDELVYIPYFVLGEIDNYSRNNLEALEGVAHFITVPAVSCADRVIVQSENWRMAYINVLSHLYGENTRPHWEKIIESGTSPKVERVSHLQEADYLLPEEWRRVIEKADGSRKKIILYNTGLGAMLEQNEAMLKKIERNLDIFKERREAIALLWRPHPLLEATLKSMRPHLLEWYRTIVEQYRKDGWGIYDDSPELHRAIAVSDAYYGDPSSLVQLYRETGKPIMIQNAEV